MQRGERGKNGREVMMRENMIEKIFVCFFYNIWRQKHFLIEFKNKIECKILPSPWFRTKRRSGVGKRNKLFVNRRLFPIH